LSQPPDWVAELFSAIDRQDAGAFAARLAEDAVFRFGNAEAVRGRASVQSAVAGFFESIAGLEHDLAEVWTLPGAIASHGTVTYTRHDRSRLTVPFATIFKLEGDLIRDYLIFSDISELYRST